MGVVRADRISKLCAYDLFEIEPKNEYTVKDIDYTNPESRCTKEMTNLNSRPEIKETINVENYDTIFVGFPIWWGREPSVVDTFLDSLNLEGKKVVIYATSGGSSIEGAVKRFKELLPNSNVVGLSRISFDISDEELVKLLNSVK